MNRTCPLHIDELDGLGVGLSTSGLLSTGAGAGAGVASVGFVVIVSVGNDVGDSLGDTLGDSLGA